MKVITIVGTRPELIRLSVIIKKLDELLGENHTLVWTGQNYDPLLSNTFFIDLDIRKPDYYDVGGSKTFANQIGDMFALVERAILEKRPDRALILGDTNSALTAILCERYCIPVYHMEAGNRCYDDKVPEEKNRRVIDAISTMNLPYVPGSRDNLLREGISDIKIRVIGNPIYEVLKAYKQQIDSSNVLEELQLKRGNYAICTIHRSENVDVKERFEEILDGLSRLPWNIIYPVHPRSVSKIEQFGLKIPDNVRCIHPLGFFSFVQLEKNAAIALTDSGTVQEECCIFGVPTVTIRDTTERPETVACGSNVVSTVDSERIIDSVVSVEFGMKWKLPEGYDVPNVSDNVIGIITS